MISKPSMIMRTIPGFLGTIHAQLYLRDILFAMQSPVLMGNDVMVGGSHARPDVDNNITDASANDWLDTVMPSFKAFVAAH